jgi:uridine monophosphate synthetase
LSIINTGPYYIVIFIIMVLSSQQQTWIVVEKLKEIGVLQYGSFLLKSGAESNYYCDFRILVSYPCIMKSIYRLIPDSMFSGVDLVCGVFFGGMALANLISFARDIPQIFVRDNEKKHGTKKKIEGVFREGQTVLLIEDVITTGGSVLEKIRVLEYYGLRVRVLTILCRGGLSDVGGVVVNSILPLDAVVSGGLEVSLGGGVVDKLYRIAFRKKSNIVLSVDLSKSADIIRLIEETRDYILGIKIHSDIIEDFHVLLEYLEGGGGDEGVEGVEGVEGIDDLVIIEDCKVADISFISLQKVKNYCAYADYITYHCLLGDDLAVSLKGAYPELGLLGVVEMSVGGCLINDVYMRGAESQLELMDGCVIQGNGIRMFGRKLPVTFSPGISLSSRADNYNQTYRNPILEKVGEFWIIGRGIYLAGDVGEEARLYRDLGWKHFLNYSIDGLW